MFRSMCLSIGTRCRVGTFVTVDCGRRRWYPMRCGPHRRVTRKATIRCSVRSGVQDGEEHGHDHLSIIPALPLARYRAAHFQTVA